jgi:hypothetical protein
MIFVGALSAASGRAPEQEGCEAKKPSALDYLALASMADSQRPLAMAAYRPQRRKMPLPDSE